MEKKILIIYTGGTIGMSFDPITGALSPLDFENLRSQIPELARLAGVIDVVSFDHPIDSSDMNPEQWVRLAEIIQTHYEQYNGFVILHGSDTLAYTASALSFMLENLAKPVIITGSQLPINTPRTDGKENMLTALEIALAENKWGQPMVPEVSVYFDSKLMRGNRSLKVSSEIFTAFQSPNFPSLARAGVHIRYREEVIIPPSELMLCVHTQVCNEVGVLKIYPGMPSMLWEVLPQMTALKALVIEVYGAGNTMNDPGFIATLQQLTQKEILVVAVTQCFSGQITLGKYTSGLGLVKAGVISGGDMTTEAVVTKLMVGLGREEGYAGLKLYMQSNVAGELTMSN